ncbi:hypothetical protein BX659_12819 [Orenia metallireducens]|uniref:DUF6602 domain-containing protein n=1 Tax=Orenia metallireducens TaxID=1413210 RepID=A0A285I6Y3_9FIRM|nr:DUF6602 domain-containing protein [Orenia metallireducens]PRX22465.1 hypothetical protein BX659_12819 [Orenia metallireducens]SNY43597.1 hypothetical protein SAMN06265827_13219 [Orenia metallireducens]
MKKNNELFDFMLSATRNMSEEYYRIQRRATEDPGTAGDQGEENWASLFRDWLSPTFQIVTKGRILSHDGKASPQIDILILQPEYPKKLIDKKLYLAGGVLAAFECKVTLKAKHIQEAIRNSVEIRKLFPNRFGTPYKELHSPITYGLLAHSHSWKNENSTPIKNIEQTLYREDKKQVNHPREMLDLICVADLATWVVSKMTYIGPNQVSEWENLSQIYGKEGCATTSYIQFSNQIESQVNNFTPIGTTINSIINKLSWENKELRRLADYFRLVNLSGSGKGYMRKWDNSIYSDEIRPRILAGVLSNGKSWDEWSITFP